MTKEIAMFLHCRECLTSNARPQMIEAGISQDGFLVVRCRRHDLPVAQFQLAENPIADLECADCGGGPDHRH